MKEFTRYLEKHMSRRRLNHSKETALYAEKLCRRFGLDVGKGYVAGLLHDVAREFSPARLIKLAGLDGLAVEHWQLEHPKLLHARAGAVFLEREFGIKDPEILDAVRCHTFGDPYMGDLAKAVYIADYVEPSRTHIDDGFRADIDSCSLDGMVLRILEHTFAHLKSQNKYIAEPSRALYTRLKKKVSYCEAV